MSNVFSRPRPTPMPLPAMPAQKAFDYLTVHESRRPSLNYAHNPVGEIRVYINVSMMFQRGDRYPIQLGKDWCDEIVYNNKLMKKAGYSFMTRHSIHNYALVCCPKNRREYAISLRLAKEWAARGNALLTARNIRLGDYQAIRDELYQIRIDK